MTKYRADIDGLRAIAVLAVVIYHADLFADAFIVETKKTLQNLQAT